MAESDKRQMGDGSDNYGEAVKQMASAVKQAGKETAKQATANTASATVQASVEGGKAAAEIAAGTASGGPWGAILSTAWALRHVLYKILICTCLFMLIIIILIVSLPSIVTNSVFGLDGSMASVSDASTLLDSYVGLATDVSGSVSEGYAASLAKVEEIIADGGYDYDLSMEALINYGQSSTGYDISYILAAYSASQHQQNTSKADMLTKLGHTAGRMFPVTYEEKEKERIVPQTYSTYRAVTVTVVTSQAQTGTINGEPQYRYTTATHTYYTPDDTVTTSEPVTKTAYSPVTVSIPIYSGDSITGTRSETYYTEAGTETVTPETEIVKYAVCTIHPFDSAVILDAFGVDPEANYDQFNITYSAAIQTMASALKMTLYGNNVPPFIGVFPSNGTRKGNSAVVEIAKMQVGNVGGYPYWSWYGFTSRVDWCACFVSWCYAQAGVSEPRFSGCTSGGMGWFQSRGQWADRNYSDIAPGDAIFFDWDFSGDADHVGIVIGTDGTNVYTIEGNSGDACRYGEYPLGSDEIRGYGLMIWN